MKEGDKAINFVLNIYKNKGNQSLAREIIIRQKERNRLSELRSIRDADILKEPTSKIDGRYFSAVFVDEANNWTVDNKIK